MCIITSKLYLQNFHNKHKCLKNLCCVHSISLSRWKFNWIIIIFVALLLLSAKHYFVKKDFSSNLNFVISITLFYQQFNSTQIFVVALDHILLPRLIKCINTKRTSRDTPNSTLKSTTCLGVSLWLLHTQFF